MSTTIIFPDDGSVKIAAIPDGVNVATAAAQLTSGEYRIVDPDILPSEPIEAWVWGDTITVDLSRLPTEPDWESALVAIHAGLASDSPTCPFCQIRLWADADLTLDARVRDFTQAFLQPLIVKAGAVQSGLNRVWAALDATQQTALNKAEIATWNEAHNLELSLPWS